MNKNFDGVQIKARNGTLSGFQSSSFGLGTDVIRSNDVDRIIVITESSYNALGTPDPEIMYLIIED